jgi:hypothetical protein
VLLNISTALLDKDVSTWAKAHLARNICIALAELNLDAPIANGTHIGVCLSRSLIEFIDLHKPQGEYKDIGPLEDLTGYPHANEIDPEDRWYTVIKGQATGVILGL